MDIDSTLGHCLVLKVGIIARGTRCLSIMRTLHSIKSVHLRFKLVGIAPVSKSIACYKYAGEMDIEIFDDYLDLLSLEHLDLILELTGEGQILSELINHKSSAIGILVPKLHETDRVRVGWHPAGVGVSIRWVGL